MTFDTDVLVWYLRGNERAGTFVAGIPFARRCLSAMAYFELLQGCTAPREVRSLQRFVGQNVSRVIQISEQVSHRVGSLLERHAASDGLQAADALIAATALVTRQELATGNIAHYKNLRGLRLVPFRP